MNLTVFAGILLAVPMAAARRASLVCVQYLFFLISTQYLIYINQLAQNNQGEKTMQAADEADEPVEAMRGAARPARLVHNTMLTFDLESIFKRF